MMDFLKKKLKLLLNMPIGSSLKGGSMNKGNDLNGLQKSRTPIDDSYTVVKDEFGHLTYRKSQSLAIGDYVICTVEVDAFDGTGGPLFCKGNAYKITNIVVRPTGSSIELSARPGVMVLSSVFTKSHLQVIKNSKVA